MLEMAGVLFITIAAAGLFIFIIMALGRHFDVF